VAAGSCASLAWATMDNLKSFKATYVPAEGKTYSCKTCHLNAIGKKGELNAYGSALQKLKGAGNAKQLTKADYQAVEKLDSDADGASNLDEITVGTNPGDPTSVPKK